MADNYQAIYDAAYQSFDISNVRDRANEAIGIALSEATRPSVLYRPYIARDGNKYIALYGEDLATGVSACGDSPAAAMEAFDKAWNQQIS